jgi:hypothetical protein
MQNVGDAHMLRKAHSGQPEIHGANYKTASPTSDWQLNDITIPRTLIANDLSELLMP